MTNKKIWAATLFSTLLLTMTISSPVKAAELQTSTTVDRSQITLPLSEETEENLFSLESVSDIQMSELVDPDEVISVSDGDDTIQARKGTATKYGWSYGTTPYTFTQKWSTDTEVYSTYPYYNDGLLYPAATELLDAPSNSQYSSAVREGYVNDTWATEQSIVGAHVYYHKVSSNKALNSVTVLLDKNVAFQIYDAELNPVLDTSSDAYEDLLLFYRTAVKYDNYDKTVYTCKLTAGNYYIMFWDNKGNEGNHHYAMFTGNPLPIQQTYSAGGVFNGKITLNFDEYDNMYDLLLSKINDPRTSVNESGKMYKSFEEAVKHYKNYKKGNITTNSSEEMSELCSLMDFVYLGRVGKSEIQN